MYYRNIEWTPDLISKWINVWQDLYSNDIRWTWSLGDLSMEQNGDFGIITNMETFNGENIIPLPPLSVIKIMLTERINASPGTGPGGDITDWLESQIIFTEDEEELEEDTSPKILNDISAKYLFDLLVGLENSFFNDINNNE